MLGGGKLAALLAALAIGPASAPLTAPQPAAVDFADAVGICRLGFVEQLQGKPPKAALARLEALPAEQRDTVKAICAAYSIGQQDLAAAIEAAREAQSDPEAKPAPGREI